MRCKIINLKSKMKKLKKLTLSKIDVEESDILQKKQMKSIFGGGYLCSCGGAVIGDATTPDGCAYLCCMHIYGSGC